MKSCSGTCANGWVAAERHGRRFGVWLLAVLLGWVNGLGISPGAASTEANTVVVLYNTRAKHSQEVAEFYARQRGIPETNVIGLSCTSPAMISRSDYEKQVEGPLREQLEARGLVNFVTDIIPAKAGQPGTVQYRLRDCRIRYLVLAYGMPYRIGNDTNRLDTLPEKVPAHMRKNGAALESDLMLLPSVGRFPLMGPANNPFHAGTNASVMTPANGVFLVSRLDGPTPELAMGLVTKAIQAERDGLWGRAYFDLRGLKEGQYKLGDDWINSAAMIARTMGFETWVDSAPATFPVSFPLSEVAIYAGWYDGDVSGPFTLPSVEFAPGAIAYHLHSFSAGNPRNANKNWVGPLIDRGATVTMGCVDEPYLQMTPNIGVFLARLAGGMNVAEAFLASLPVLSWQTILVGDPLYRPFVPNLLERGREMNRTNSPLLPYAVWQTLNFQLNQGLSVDEAIKALEDLPVTTNSPVLSEKLARLFEQKSRLKPAIAAAERALALGGTPQQRVRLMLDLADWQRVLDQPPEAYATLERFAREFPGHPRLLSVRRQQLDYAKDLRWTSDIERLKAEIDRLSPPPAAKP